MRKGLALILVSVLAVVLFAGVGWAQAAQSSRVLIGFYGSPDPAAVEAAGGRVIHVYGIVPAVCAEVPSGAVEALRSHPAIRYVEPDGVCHALAQTLPWGVNDVGSPYVCWHGNLGQGVRLAVLDTGVDMDHPDLSVLGGYDFYNNDEDPDDDHGHGTAVAGVAAALDNEVGPVGVAPQVDLYAVKVLGASGSGPIGALVAGLDWCRSRGINVVNMSLGTTVNYQTLEAACQNAWNAGMVLAAAAGNGGTPGGGEDTVLYPARYPSVIAVVATDYFHARPSWSATGPSVELSAPGVDIYTTAGGGGCTVASGTSFSCPHVAAVACLVKCAHPSYPNLAIREAMDSTAHDLGQPGWDPLYGYGLVWAPGAVSYGATPSDAVKASGR
ncbi:MAG: S8 family serine peptidase [Acetobacteraceae bacterium]|nr:S8 family serine peptidase [Acetobacteraceae bacterium]